MEKTKTAFVQPAGYGTAGGRTARSARGGRRRSNWRKCAGRGGKQHWRGTATLDTAAGTLVLENVTLDGSLSIRPASAFTVTVLGANSFAPAEGISADRANTPALAIRLQQGSSLTLSAWGGANAVYCPAGSAGPAV